MRKTTSTRASRPLDATAAILALTLAGCGGGKGEVVGKVRFNGQALSAGRVTLVSATNPGAVAYSLILKDGTYKVTDCPSGPVRIAVQTVVPRSGRLAVTKSTAGGSLMVPVRYADPSTSGLEYTVRAGWQRHDIDLTP
jgi:hypothetical protein